MMPKPSRQLRPLVERIEAKALLSGVIPGSVGAGLFASPIVEKVVPLDGTFHGTFHWNRGVPDVGETFVPTGSGHLGRTGRVSVTGSIQTTGFIAHGHAGGTLTLRRGGSTITLELTGIPVQSGFAGLPSSFTYTVISGTGQYHNVTDRGTATLVTVPASTMNHPDVAAHGTFKLVLTSSNSTTTA
jgi:hypothetical protein